jgi:hypothetical protein
MTPTINVSALRSREAGLAFYSVLAVHVPAGLAAV